MELHVPACLVVIVMVLYDIVKLCMDAHYVVPGSKFDSSIMKLKLDILYD